MGGFGFRMPQYGGGMGGGSLPDAPRFGPAPYAPHGGVSGEQGYGGVMPYQPNPVAEGMEAIGKFLNGIAQQKEQKRQQAEHQFKEGMRLQEQGFPVDQQRMIKLGRDSGLPFDFKNGTVTPNLGGAPQPQQPPQGMQQPNPPMPQGMQLPPNPAMQQPGPAPMPPGYQDAQNAPMRQMNPLAMQGQYNMQPQQGKFGAIASRLGLGSAPINPASPGAQGVQQMMQGAEQQGKTEAEMKRRQMELANAEYQDKIQTAEMMSAYYSGKGPDGRPLPPEAMFQLEVMLQRSGKLGKMDIIDIPILAAYHGVKFDTTSLKKAARSQWEMKNPGEYQKHYDTLMKEFMDSGMEEEPARQAVEARLSNMQSPVPIPESAERQKWKASNLKMVTDQVPGIEQLFAKNPLIQDLAERGKIADIFRLAPDLLTKTTRDAQKQQADMGNDAERVKQGWANVDNNRRQTNISAGQLGVAQGNLGLRRQEFNQGLQDKGMDRSMKIAMDIARIQEQEAAGKISTERATELIKQLSVAVPGSSVQMPEDNWFSADKPLQWNAPQSNDEKRKQIIGTGSLSPTPPAQQASPPRAPAAPMMGPQQAYKQLGVMGTILPAQVQDYANAKGISFQEALKEAQRQGLIVPGYFSQGAVPSQSRSSFGNINNR